jgi:hypothetical protein
MESRQIDTSGLVVPNEHKEELPSRTFTEKEKNMNLQIESGTMNKRDISSQATLHTLADEHETERYSPPALSLDANGYIQECDKTVEKLFGYLQHELLWQHISCLFPKFLEMNLLQGNRLNPMLSYICHCGYAFEAINKQSETVICNLNFFLMESEGTPNLRMIVRYIANAKS